MTSLAEIIVQSLPGTGKEIAAKVNARQNEHKDAVWITPNVVYAFFNQKGAKSKYNVNRSVVNGFSYFEVKGN